MAERASQLLTSQEGKTCTSLTSFYLHQEEIEPKESINKMKRQPTEREKIFANRVFAKGQLSKRYKELLHL